jgi:predicted  nucleic acid-binding Zn-ribbon protein
MTLAKILFDLQQIDLDIQGEQEALDDIDRRLADNEVLLKAKAELVAATEHLAEVEKQQRDAEWEVEDLRNKVAGISDKLYSGRTKNPKELVDLEKEAGVLKANLGQKEDTLLDLMAETEAVQDKIKLHKERVQKLEEERKREQESLSQQQAKSKKWLSGLDRSRQALISEIAPETLDLYQGIRSRKGQAVVKIEQGRCHGCHLNLSMNELHRARAGVVTQCSSCGRILYLG